MFFITEEGARANLSSIFAVMQGMVSSSLLSQLSYSYLSFSKECGRAILAETVGAALHTGKL